MKTEEDFDRLVGLIYESALDPGLWRKTMNELARQVGADTLQLLGGGGQKQAVTPGEIIGIMREPGRGPFSPAQESLLGRLVPHLERSLRLVEHTRAATLSGELAAAGQDAASLTLIAVNKLGQLLYRNRHGEALLKAAEVLWIQHGVLTCAHQNQEQACADILEGVVKTGHPANLLLNNRVKPDERYSVTLMPLSRRGAFSQAGVPDGVLCLVVPLDLRRMATAQQLMQLFGLTAAEARLARAMAAGDTLEAYALESELKLPTIKSQLRAVFEKTGADRQAALVRLIVAIPAVREPA